MTNFHYYSPQLTADKKNSLENMCLHQLFEAQVQRTPDALALVVEHEHFSYTQLNQHANLLARHLQLLGVKPEVLVGLCLPRTPLLLIALLAILKAGGAYVPLDPSYPPERLRFQALDAHLHLLLTSQHLHALWQDLSVPQYHFDQLPTLPNQPDAVTNLESSVLPEHLAYLIYTSGSTGHPKGVCIAHRNTVAMLDWVHQHYSAHDLRGVLAGTSLCFDLSLFELFAPWSQGGTVYLAQTPLHLPTGPQRDAITLLNTVPSVIAELVGARAIPPSVRVINMAGEPLPPPLVQQLSALPTIQRVYNLYGPTEDTTYSTWHRVSLEGSHANVSIGRPLDYSQLYLLDPFEQPAPIGVMGEIYLGGAGVTRGYWQRPDLTAERYVPDPFGSQPGGRLYRTGDLARYRANGQLDYLGRIDHQVKIRGFRIELGEIENVLRQQPQIEESVVLAHHDASKNTQMLVAYLVPTEPQEHIVEQIRKVLKEHLPEYMIPNLFVLLTKLPKTSNGKIDRQALPAPQIARERDEGKQDPPRTPLEQEIATIWARVLHIDPPGRTENFFEIGGHSLLGMQVIARIRDQFGIDLPLRQIFETPTIQELTQAISQNGPHNDAPLSEYEPELQRISRDQALLLSFAQQRLWILDQLDPGTSTYNISLAVRLSGPLQKRALEQSLHAIVARHETLRTTFRVSEGMPTQHITSLTSATYPINFSLIDARNWSSPEQERLTDLFIREEASQPFDLAIGPLIRGRLLWINDTEHILVLTLHHIIADGWSLRVIGRELSTLYQAFHTGTSAQLPDLPIQYADYTVWQRQRLQGEALERLLQYWKQQLAELPSMLALPTDRARPPKQTFKGSNYTFHLSHALTRSLQQIGQSEGATLFMTLLATFQILLCRYSGQEDIAIATPIANRPRVEFENLIGLFINTLVLRTDLRKNPSFRTLLQKVRTIALDAYLHQDAPFEQVVNAIQPERDMAYAPLCQVAFQLQNLAQEVVEMTDIALKTIEHESTTTKFDITLTINEQDQGLEGEFEYNSDLFDRSTIVRMATHFQHLLESVVRQPEQRIWHLPMLGTAEFQQIVFDWNQTHVAYPLERPTHQLVEAWAEQRPETLALIAGDEHITYRELNQRANQLAHYLLAHGLQPGNVVGIYQERTIAMIVSLLAVFKVGGAYIPIDPAYPTDRLAFILRDSQTIMLLTQERLAQKLAAIPNTHPISVDTEQAKIALEDIHNPMVTITGDNLAYIIYTSGSTGTPKGVAISHQSLLNLIYWHQRTSSIQPTDRSTHLAGLGFDATIWELWPYLATGAQIHLANEETRIAPQQWQSWIKQQGITISFLPTPLVEHVLALDWSKPTTLRMLHTGGDQLHHHPPTHIPFTLVNNYGPTENTVVATSTIVPAQEQANRLPTIGRPISNAQIYILDQELQPQPIGVPGELYIGGSSLAQGYLHRPELTAESFVPHPFSAQPGERLYRTGDLVKYLADGSLEFLGRRDFQVKIRGYRIELGEIATLLTEHPEIRENIVVIRKDHPEEKRLVAYVVLHQSSQITSEELHRYLHEKLPAYMVPSAIMILDDLPTNANGKVDRQALPPPHSEMTSSKSHVAPRDAVELKLTHIWENLLQSGPIGVTDDFFELGGHSLLAVRLMAQIRRDFQQDLPLSILFQGATPEQLATVLRQQHRQEKHSALIEIQAGGTKPPFFCAHPVGGEILCYVDLARQLGPEQPFYGLQMPTLQTTDQHTRQEYSPSIEEMALAYLREVQRIQPTGPYLLGGWSMGGVIAFEMAQQLARQGQYIAMLALFDSYVPSIQQQNAAPSMQQIIEDLTGLFDQALSIDYTELQTFSHEEQLAQLSAYLKRANILPPDIEAEQLSRLFSNYKKNTKALYRYQPQMYPGHLTLFCAASSAEKKVARETHGWHAFLQQEPIIHTIPGNHYTILKNPHLDDLVKHLKHDLEDITE